MTATTTHEPILRLDDLDVAFTTETGRVPAVRGVCLDVRPGETLALVGESGSGKSTVALAAMGLLPGNAHATGRALIAGTDVLAARESDLTGLRGRTVSMVFQEPATALDPLTRVGAQIAEVVRNHRDVSAREARHAAVELLRRVGIPDPERRASAYPFQLSGGQRQRVVIAMAIANDPGLLIADEPTTALDVTVQTEILDLLRELAVDAGTGVLLVTHNMGVVADFADRVAVMLRGEIVETGPVEEVLLRPAHEYTKRLLAAVPRLTVAEAGAADTDGAGDRAEGSGTASEAPVVDLDRVGVVFGRGSRAVRALDGVSLTVRPGETVGLVGESGSGKSTAARVALGLIRPSSGSVSLFDTDLRKASARTRRTLRAGIGVVLQDPVASLDARMTVGECVAEPLRVHRRDLPAAERRARVAEALERVQLPRALADRAPRELSGGQRQRVSLARALVLEPQLLVADEPTSALDVSVQEAVLTVIAELQRDLGFACLFVSHDLAVVQRFAQRVVVMRGGHVEEHGTTGTTLLRPRTDYTRRLLAAVPVPDPVLQRQRRLRRQAAGSGADA
ncbi:dipeptide ABC transporter ATP-binding protein [Streptantibioticus cattleyicolor]|uniref:Oligopeptide ABC transporter ATP-binding protein n=1 Tax=Streptantibioticus cattleyicolor (strain ATCC 35852 / DSM 46488 / JCM 4925 / NBRC 14057 / NRRL 8057) TaxID=1003195 RepID=F8JKC8_STREN|nr:ABC transporter ATP-binding protein [Streptantibioticus cattleyicolor]AEW98508.1 oligopeptide ABC transporter ATP-binding protein [Streptantibioticus cattleyicolor NRRL 8057 = DSM 46488]CCB72434.1 putative peptide transport fused subunits of ABC superfamily: ATP-binding components [Streptantibioticus cattleyicolor NRRL 8057 = DSM 46488]